VKYRLLFVRLERTIKPNPSTTLKQWVKLKFKQNVNKSIKLSINKKWIKLFILN